MITCKTKTVELRDGTALTFSEEDWDVGMKLSELERAAVKNPLDDLNGQVFRYAIYPKLAASCISGNLPPEDEVRHMPTAEQNKMWAAVMELNPHWDTNAQAAGDPVSGNGAHEKKRKRSRVMSKTG